jgi:hypothetical protein
VKFSHGGDCGGCALIWGCGFIIHYMYYGGHEQNIVPRLVNTLFHMFNFFVVNIPHV